MDRYKTSRAEDQDSDDAEPLTYAGITSKSKNIETLEAKLSTHFEGLPGEWWYEVTVKREKPEGMRLQVNLGSSRYNQL